MSKTTLGWIGCMFLGVLAWISGEGAAVSSYLAAAIVIASMEDPK